MNSDDRVARVTAAAASIGWAVDDLWRVLKEASDDDLVRLIDELFSRNQTINQ